MLDPLMFQKAMKSVGYVQRRFHDAVNAIDHRFTLHDIEAMMDRDDYLPSVERFVTDGGISCLYLLVSDQLYADEDESKKKTHQLGSQHTSNAVAAQTVSPPALVENSSLNTPPPSNLAAATHVDQVLFVPRIVNITGVASVIYALRLPTKEGQEFSVENILFGSVQADDAMSELADISRNILLPMQSVYNQQCLKKCSSDFQIKRNPHLRDSHSGSSQQSVEADASGSDASVFHLPQLIPSVLIPPIPEGYANPRSAERTDDEVQRCIRAVNSALDSIQSLRQDTALLRIGITKQSAAHILHRVINSQKGIAKAAEDSHIAGDSEALIALWAHYLKTTCSKDGLSGFTTTGLSTISASTNRALRHFSERNTSTTVAGVSSSSVNAPVRLQPRRPTQPRESNAKLDSVAVGAAASTAGATTGGGSTTLLADDIEEQLSAPHVYNYDFQLVPETFGPLAEIGQWKDLDIFLRGQLDIIGTDEISAIAKIVAICRPSLHLIWQNAVSRLHSLAEEARQCIKYLITIERFFQPLYGGDLGAAKLCIADLVKSISTLQQVVPFYNQKHHIRLVVQSVSHQIITCSKNAIRRQGRLWEQIETCPQIEVELQQFYAAIAVSRHFQEQLGKDAGLCQGLDELAAFGRLELFCSRLVKLADLFSTTKVFRTIENYELDGVESILTTFFGHLDDLRRKSGDSLDYTKPSFDTDYMEFRPKVADVDCSLQVYVNSCFENISSAATSLNLLKKFSILVQRPSLRADLQAKYLVLFQRYGLELEAVQRVYELCKADPPISRNAPPVAGRIAWARQLLPRIEAPMQMFQASQALVSHQRETTKIIRLYNRIALALTEYEAFWVAAWVKIIPNSMEGVRATLLVRNDESYMVNFDPAVGELMREAKWLFRMGVDLPPAAMELVRLRSVLVNVKQLQFTMDWAKRAVEKINPRHVQAMQPLVQQMDLALQPGLNTVSWNSAAVGSFTQHAARAVLELESTVDRINAVVDNRISVALHEISSTILVPRTANNQPFTIEELFAHQQECAERGTVTFSVANATLCEAVVDICRFIDPRWSPSQISSAKAVFTDGKLLNVDPSVCELDRLYMYYNRQLFKAVLAAVTTSLTLLKTSLGTLVCDSNFIIMPTNNGATGSFLKLAADLCAPHIVVTPPVEVVQHTINECVKMVLQCTAKVGAWEIDALTTDFVEEISRNKETVKVVLLLAGTVLGVHQYVDDFLKHFSRFSALWLRDPKAVVKQFAQTNRPLLHVEEEFVCCEQLASQISFVEDESRIGCFALDCTPAKRVLFQLCQTWKEAYAAVLHQSMEDRLNALFDRTEYLVKRTLQPVPIDFSCVQEELAILDNVNISELEVDAEIIELQDCCLVLDKHHVSNAAEHLDRMLVLRNKWRKLHQHAHEKRDSMSSIQYIYKRDVFDAANRFGVDIICFRNDFEAHGPLNPDITPAEAAERLKKFQRMLADKLRRWQLNGAAQSALGFSQSMYPELAKTAKEIHYASMLYSLYQQVAVAVAEAKRSLWCDLQYDKIVASFTQLENELKRLPSEMKIYIAYTEMKSTIEKFIELEPVIEQLSHPSIRERHWTHVMRICGSSWSIEPHIFRLEFVLNANIMPNIDDIMDLTLSSEKEAELEHRLRDLIRDWKDRTFTFASYKHRGLVTLKPEETSLVKELLDETLVALGAIVASKYVAPFRQEATLWTTKLTLVGESLSHMLEVQGLWIYLESVFSTGDIMKQLPSDTKRFSMVDKQWMKIFAKARDIPNVVDFVSGNEVKSLGYLRDQLELCQRSLTTYLEQKRAAFSRFFFVSDSVLLEVLAQGSDPSVMQPHFPAIFDGVCTVVFEQSSETRLWRITAIRSAEQEVVQLAEPFLCDGAIEDWLLRLCTDIQRAIRIIMREAVADLTSIRSDVTQIKKFFFQYPSQVVLTAFQINFTQSITEVLGGKPADRKEMPRRLTESKDVLSEYARLELTANQRTHIQTLTTMAVHNLEVWEDSVKRAKDPQSFEWQRQVRFYWTDRNQCVLRIADAEIIYSNEYLGIKERLVITPLTDRCYTTLSQALSMHMGGAPVGPAGTGKTETVKDLGRAAGKYVVVFNCGDQWDVRSLGKIFRGLAQSGCWGCFDEFNRIPLSVLSVVSQQLHTIFVAQKQRKKEFIFADGLPCRLAEGAGVFITMNPGYAGRVELPENLKAMFRSVSMMVPDKLSIMKTKLAASGYKLDKTLSKKFCLLYEICEQQLSKQNQYDFGLRNILSVLRSAGDVLRQSGSMDEESTFAACLRDMNISKLVDHDVPVFLSLMSDLFTSTATESTDTEIVVKIRSCATEAALIPTRGWVDKCKQLYMTKLVRHGLMMVGPAGSGKSTCIATLLRALPALEKKTRYKEIRMSPKAITADQMYGHMDVETGDWTDGIFSYLWRAANKERNVSVWLICDGPVDTHWVESLNTVLDDNKLLTLANGDRIAMQPTMKLCFETENLNNASPATVSRAGIVVTSMDEVGWAALLEARCAMFIQSKQWSAPAHDTIVQLGSKHFVPLFKAVRHYNSYFNTPLSHYTIRLLDILHGLVKNACELNSAKEDEETIVVRLFWYALAWALGGSLDVNDRKLLSDLVAKEVPGLQMKKDPTEYKGIFDHFVDVGAGGRWVLWETLVPKLDLRWDPSHPYVSIANVFVPSLDSTVMHALISSHLERGQPVLVIGQSGCAKTVTIEKLLADTMSDSLVWKKTNVSRSTTPMLMQRGIEELCEKRVGSMFGPQRNRRLTLFVDDLNMTHVNEWGDREVNELWRQILETRGLYCLNRIGEWKKFVDLKYVAAATTSTSGNTSCISSRLLRHFSVYNLPLPSTPTLEKIFDTLLRGRLGHTFLAPHLASVVTATLSLWSGCAAKLLSTPTRCHYNFSLTDLSNIVQGMLMLDIGSCTSVQVLLSVWVNECSRAMCDKLSHASDCAWFQSKLAAVWAENFQSVGEFTAQIRETTCANFLRLPTLDTATGELVYPPKVYEVVQDRAHLVHIVQQSLEQYARKRGTRLPPLDLVLFDTAMEHICRVCRTIATPHSSILLIGVGGSGKQTTARVAAWLQGQPVFQPLVTQGYTVVNFLDDLRGQYLVAGVQGPAVFLLTDNEIHEEHFLDYINSAMAGADVSGLFNVEERDAVRNAIRPIAKRMARRQFEDSEEWLWNFFMTRVRDNLHFVICLSPQHRLFEDRVRQFPSIMSACTVDYFFPWAASALVQVAKAQLASSSFKIVAKHSVMQALPCLLADIHSRVQSLCIEYATNSIVHATPELFLTFLDTYKCIYRAKEKELCQTFNNLTQGLQKLDQAGTDVAKMKTELAVSEQALFVATRKVNDLLVVISEQTDKALVQKIDVQTVTDAIAAEAAKIAAVREEAEIDLVAAQPALLSARQALDQISANDMNTLKAMWRPPQMIRRIFDGICILLHEKLEDTTWVMNGKFSYLADSWNVSGRLLCCRPNLIDILNGFNDKGKDRVNDETCELLQPYLQAEDFVYERAKIASGNIAGLCTWVRAMEIYRRVSKFVAPKIEALQRAEVRLRAANLKLAAQKAELAKAEAVMAECVLRLSEVKADKLRLEAETIRTRRRLTYSTELIAALGDERRRWETEQQMFSHIIAKLVGDVAAASAFVTYGGPFNAEFRVHFAAAVAELIDTHAVTSSADKFKFSKFMVSESQVTEWQLQNLPMDDHSVENAIIATTTLKPPLFVDTQSQMIRWVQQFYASSQSNAVTTKTSAKLFSALVEQQLLAGAPLIVEDVAIGVHPLLDSLIQFRLVENLASPDSSTGVSLLGVVYEFQPTFRLWMLTKSATAFSPEVFASVAVIDASVTLIGLQQQLLSEVITAEKKELELHREAIRAELFDNERKLRHLEDELLEKLSASEGSLVDDESLILTLQHSKASAEEIKFKLSVASDTQAKIADARGEFAPVAVRGAVLYFVGCEMSRLSYSYQLSLDRLLRLFRKSLAESQASTNIANRIKNVTECMTQIFFSFVGRGLLEVHKPIFTLILAIRIHLSKDSITQQEYAKFLQGGNAVDYEELVRTKPKPVPWMQSSTWMHVSTLISVPKFSSLRDTLGNNESLFRAWIEHDAPETETIPIYKDLTPFEKLWFVRCFRIDRTLSASILFARDTLGTFFTEVLPFDLSAIVAVEAMQVPRTPILFLVSTGSDPTQLVENLAKKRRKSVSLLSLGQGQEASAMSLLTQCVASGDWVVFQNCHISPGFLRHLQLWSEQPAKLDHIEFRLFISSEPTEHFPLPLLQSSLMLTNEPPTGTSATFAKVVNLVQQDTWDASHRPDWRSCIYALCFFHTTLLQRARYGVKGWTAAYQFSDGDFNSSLVYLLNHFTAIGEDVKRGPPISWDGVRYMIGDIHYGGRITRSHDRRTLEAITDQIFTPAITEPKAMLCPDLNRFPIVTDIADVAVWRSQLLSQLNYNEPPTVFGLDANAELSYRTEQSSQALTLLLGIQPKSTVETAASSAGMLSREATLAQALKLLERKCPKLLIVEKKSSSAVAAAKGSSALNPLRPLYIVFMHELRRVNAAIQRVQDTVASLSQALAGTATMTPALVAIADSLYLALVPEFFTAITWTANSLASWLVMLNRRCEQVRNFTQAPNRPCFDISALFNPLGFMNAIRQEICRKRAHDGWVLERVETKFSVTRFRCEDMERPPEEGAYVTGMYLDGASWDVQRMRLRPALPLELYHEMPVVHISASLVSAGANKAGERQVTPPNEPNPGSGFLGQQSYRTHRNQRDAEPSQLRKVRLPCFTSPRRGDTSFLCNIDLVHDDASSNAWIIRGVALLTCIE